MASSSSLQQSQRAPNGADLFDAYFRRADLDRDGRISGAEAVAFFQGSGLPKSVLAQVWNYADHKRSGFLGRAEFFNALKLITVAQSKRELTPDIVKAALYSPAAAEIPAPQIRLPTQTAPQSNAGGSVSTAHAGSFAPTALSSPGPRATQLSPGAHINQQQFPSQGSHGMRPPLSVSGTVSRPVQGIGGQGFPTGGSVTGMQPPNANIPSSWVGGKASGGAPGAVSQVPNRGTSASATQAGIGQMALGSTTSLPPRPPTAPKMMPTASQAKDSISSGVSRNGFSSNSAHGGDAFSAITSHPKQNSSTTNLPVSAGNQSLQPSPGMQSVGLQLPRAQSFVKQNQQISNNPASMYTPPRVSAWAGDSASGQYQQSWPKMTQSDIQKYAKVFSAVDTDKDGKISGAQARNLFLSWRLPREILKQVWDLSDQDNDSMLSLKEFCIALYLMERYREGRPLPAVVPSSILSDLSTSGPPITGHSTASWGPKSDWAREQSMPPNSSGQQTAGMGLPDPVAAPHDEERPQSNQQKSKVPVLEKHLLDQLSQEEQDSLNSKFKEATDSEKKVAELEKEIQDSREKIEFYRTKMQELVLYKSRCDNRLNEITERISADKREVEFLAKKYEEKYKQVGDVASRLTIEEATFRDIQEKKMELYQSILKMDQGSGTDENLKASVERIQGELDELVMALNERCKQYGLRGKPSSLLELPFGWQPGIQEGAADWDGDWDKFEDEGFTFVKELTLEVQNVAVPPKQKSVPPPISASGDERTTVDTPAESAETATETVSTKDHDTVNSEKLTGMPGNVRENGSEYDRSEKETVASETGSPVARSVQESPSKDLAEPETGRIQNTDSSPHEKETHSDQEGSASMFDKSVDEPAWGTFDTNDDIDSVWGFTPANATKDNDHEKYGENYFFGSEDLGLNPIKTQPSETAGLSPKKNTFSFDESVPSTPLYYPASLSQKKSTFVFDESVPSTPLYSSANSPPKYWEGSQSSFDRFSRFDSFNMQDSGLFAPQDNHLSRFDSFRSNNEYDYGHGFSTFDDSDPFGSGPFKTSIESQTPRRFSDSDPSGSGPFKTSLESQTPRSSYDSDPFGTGTFKTTTESQTPRGSFDSDIFGTEPFRTSRESHTPGSSDNWSAF